MKIFISLGLLMFFRSDILGTNIKKIKNLRLIEDDGDIKYYVRTEEDLKIGNAILLSASYGFYKDRLFKITLQVGNDWNDCLEILSSLHARYGTETKSVDDGEYQLRYWIGHRVLLYCGLGVRPIGQVSLTGDVWPIPVTDRILPDNNNNEMFLEFFSKSLLSEWLRSQNNKASNGAASDGF